MVYAAIYEDSCEVGFEAAKESGLRVILGKMMMDVGSYGQLQPKKVLSVSLVESERLCRKWHRSEEGRLEYAFSPRFAVTCSEKMMRSAAELAARFEAYLQTHLAENREEIEKVHHLFMSARDYTHVYETCGMLTPRTVLGHCIHLNPREIAAIAAAQSSIAHCPSSNLFLGSGLIKLDQLLKAGIAVGLGSDVAAGPELNMWQVMRAAIEVQKARGAYEPNLRPLRASEAFYLATQGGARALGKAKIIGTLDAGKEADFRRCRSCTPCFPIAKIDNRSTALSTEDVLALCIYRGGPHSTLETYVRGKCVYRRRPNFMKSNVFTIQSTSLCKRTSAKAISRRSFLSRPIAKRRRESSRAKKRSWPVQTRPPKFFTASIARRKFKSFGATAPRSMPATSSSRFAASPGRFSKPNGSR